jgi:adenylate cyclase
MKSLTRRKRTRGILGIVFGLGAALLSLSPYASLLEEKIGLGLLFALRGQQPAPAEVAIVNIDRESANQPGLSDNPAQWPRRLHAELIRRLHAAGAELIGFNIFFSAPQAQDDADMAAAMREADSVVLANFLRLKHLQGGAYVESLEEPPSILAEAAKATAPFLLPQGEEADRFLARYGESGDHPTLPTALLRQFAIKRLAGLTDYLLRESGQTLNGMPLTSLPPAEQAAIFAALESTLSQHPEVQSKLLRQLRELKLPPGQAAPLRSLLETLTGENTRYFNHYGPTGSIVRIPYYQLLAQQDRTAAETLRGRIVLVGFDEDFQPEGLFFSPFSSVSSLDLAATAVANLLNHNDIRPVFNRLGQSAWLLLWGMAIGLLATRRLRVGVGSIVLLSFLYLAAAGWLFSAYALWLPVLLPLFLLAPAGTLSCLLNNYLNRWRENRQIHSVIERFIPEEAAQRDSTLEERDYQSKTSFGVCLSTDAGQYTALAETLRPVDLGTLMNEYYSALYPAVRQHGGWVSDVIGDAMMAVWSVEHDGADMRAKALHAALAMLRTVNEFEARRNIKLPIRMGLHYGEMSVGFVGGEKHGAYRAVGDTVNIASRLEGLNKLLGTRILVSEAMVAKLPGFATRPIGKFMLPGKTHAVAVHELLAPLEATNAGLIKQIGQFSEALTLFQLAQWREAAAAFAALTEAFPEDGPCRFYYETAKSYAENPEANPDLSTITVNKPPPGALAQS